MNTINCRILQNEYQDIPGVGVTPAEAIVLRQIHDPNAANFAKSANPEEKANFWKFIRIPRAAGVATTATPDTEDEEKETIRPRTDSEEVARLRQKYNVRAKSGAHGTHIMDDLFPGESPTLPQTFEEIGMSVAPPEEVKLKGRRGPKPARQETDNE